MLFQEEGTSILLFEIYNIHGETKAVLERTECVYGTEMPDKMSRTEWGKY